MRQELIPDMMVKPEHNVLILSADGNGLADLAETHPFVEEAPEAMVFCCFFRSLEARSRLLADLQRTAGSPPPPDDERETHEVRIASEFAELALQGAHADAMVRLIRWWAGLKRQTYQVYRLRVAAPPYVTSCVITFSEIPEEELRTHVTGARTYVEAMRRRILDGFGLELE